MDWIPDIRLGVRHRLYYAERNAEFLSEANFSRPNRADDTRDIGRCFTIRIHILISVGYHRKDRTPVWLDRNSSLVMCAMLDAKQSP